MEPLRALTHRPLKTAAAGRSTAADKSYWHQVSLINLQLKGLFDGYSQAAKADSTGSIKPLIFESILYMNLGDELGVRTSACVNMQLTFFVVRLCACAALQSLG
eukprot:SAG31_NODE_108_length_24741_cov_6.933041_17_plen_104_part_00